MSSAEGDGDSIRVVVRVRPFTAREKAHNCACCVTMEGNTVWLTPSDPDGHKDKKDFTFDNCYWSHDRSHPDYASQDTVFNDIGQATLDNAFSGYNVCVFAYGQTGSGKSYSMVGSEEDRGIVPRVAMALFEYIERQKEKHDNVTFEVVTSMIEIYSEKIRDLLGKGRAGHLKVREDPKMGPYVEGLTAMSANSYREIERQLVIGNNARSVASTHMNDVSSRAHTIFSIKFSQTMVEEMGDGVARETKKVSKINLVDLAGSERQSNKQLSASEQARFKEGIAINKSLSALSNCIFALFKQSQEGKGGKQVHVPYRDSQLTWLLKESLGGNAKTIMLAAISPADINFEESLSTLQYAARAKRIKTNAVVNEDINNKIIRELRAEIEKLRQQVAGQGNDEVEELRRQLLESRRMIEQMNSTFKEQSESKTLSEPAKEAWSKPDLSAPQFVNLSEDPMMTECLVYYIAPGVTVLGSDVDEGLQRGEGGESITGIPLVGQSIAPKHCRITRGDSGSEVVIEAIEGAVTFVNGRRISGATVLKQGNRIVVGSSHIFRFHDPIEAAKLRKEREEYMASHPNEAVTAPSVIDWSYATQELKAMNDPGGGEGTGAVTPLSTAQTDEGDVASPRDKHHHRVHNQDGDGEGGVGGEDESEESEEEEEDDDFIPLEGLDGDDDDADLKPVLAGIGVLVQRLGGHVTVVDLVNGGPAALSGELRIGQVVLEVDGKSVDTMSFNRVLQLIRGPVGSWIELMVQDPIQQGGSGVRIIRLQRGLLPAKPSDVGLDEDDETEGGIISGSEESEEDSDDEALDLNALGDDLPGAGTTPPHGSHHHHHHQHSHQVQGGGGVLSSEMTGVPQGQYGRSPQLRAMKNEEGGIMSVSDEDDEDEDDESEGSDFMNLEEMEEEPEALDGLEGSEDGSESSDGEGESLEALESLETGGSEPVSKGGHAGVGSAASPQSHSGAGGGVNHQHHHQSPGGHGAAGGQGGSQHASPQQQQQQQQGGPRKSQQGNAPLCIKIDVEPTNKSTEGYSLMFNVESVAAGLRYGVAVRDHKTMLKVYPRCFCGPEALDWLTQHALKAFLIKEHHEPGKPVGDRLNILARSAALLLAQRLVETEVFTQVNKTKARQPFTDQGALFRFREDEKAGPILNTRHAWNCRARPPAVVAADLLHKAICLHLQPIFPAESSDAYNEFMQVAEELQMADISLLFRKAETSFFINLHNALMLHTHYYRRTNSGDSLKPLRSKLSKLHQYKVGGQTYCIDDMRQRLLRHRMGGGKCDDPRLHFALSLGSMSCPDVRVFGVDELDAQLTEAAQRYCERHVRVDIASDRSSSSSTTLLLPKLFKWHGKVFGVDRLRMLQAVSQWVADPAVKQLLEEGNCRIKHPDYDWRKRPAGSPP